MEDQFRDLFSEEGVAESGGVAICAARKAISHPIQSSPISPGGKSRVPAAFFNLEILKLMFLWNAEGES